MPPVATDTTADRPSNATGGLMNCSKNIASGERRFTSLRTL